MIVLFINNKNNNSMVKSVIICFIHNINNNAYISYSNNDITTYIGTNNNTNDISNNMLIIGYITFVNVSNIVNHY